MEDRLQKFAQLVDAGSFTKAAEKLHISQPALSTAISKLERELHTSLLIRGAHALKLTPSGEIAYAHAKETAIRMGNLKASIAGSTEKLALRIGMFDSLADTLFSSGLDLSELEQQASVALIIDNSRYLTAAIARDDIDLAFVVTQPHYPSLVTAAPIGSEPLVLVCHHAQRQAVQQALQQRTLSNFISYDENSTTSQLIRKAFDKQHITLQPALYSTSPEVVRKLVLAQKGAAVLPYLSVRDHIRDGQLALMRLGKDSVIDRPIQTIRHQDKLLPAAVTKIVQDLQRTLTELNKEVTSLYT